MNVPAMDGPTPTSIFVRPGADRRRSYDPARRVRFSDTHAAVPDEISGDCIAASQPVPAMRSSASRHHPEHSASNAHERPSLARALLTEGVSAAIGEDGERDFALASQRFSYVAMLPGDGKLAAKALRNLQSLAEAMNDDDVRSRVHRLADRRIDTDPDFAFEIYERCARAELPSASRDLAREKISNSDFIFPREQAHRRRSSYESFERFGEDFTREGRQAARRAARVALKFHDKLQPYAQMPPTQRLGVILGIRNYVDVDPTAAHHARRELLRAAGDIEQNSDLGAVGAELKIELERAAQAYPATMMGGELDVTDIMDDINESEGSPESTVADHR